jgi:hypothetical protein
MDYWDWFRLAKRLGKRACLLFGFGWRRAERIHTGQQRVALTSKWFWLFWLRVGRRLRLKERVSHWRLGRRFFKLLWAFLFFL